VENLSFFKSLSASLSSGLVIGRNISVFRPLSDSWTTNARYARGTLFAENLQANFGTQTVLSGHYYCINCGGSVSALFGFLVIAFGVLIFGVYAIMQRRQSRGSPREQPEKEKVLVDKEGWETKVPNSQDASSLNSSKNEGNRQAKGREEEESTETKLPGDESWETKPDS
jgi:hypothetical protein